MTTTTTLVLTEAQFALVRMALDNFSRTEKERILALDFPQVHFERAKERVEALYQLSDEIGSMPLCGGFTAAVMAASVYDRGTYPAQKEA